MLITWTFSSALTTLHWNDEGESVLNWLSIYVEHVRSAFSAPPGTVLVCVRVVSFVASDLVVPIGGCDVGRWCAVLSDELLPGCRCRWSDAATAWEVSEISVGDRPAADCCQFGSTLLHGGLPASRCWVVVRDAPMSHWPIVIRPVFGTEQSDYWPIAGCCIKLQTVSQLGIWPMSASLSRHLITCQIGWISGLRTASRS